MYGNMHHSQFQHQQLQLPIMGNYQSTIHQNQNHSQAHSIYAQFSMPNSSYNVSQPSAQGFSNQGFSSQQINGGSIYPNQSLVDQSMCINSPLPLRAGDPVTTVLSQWSNRNRGSSSSNYGQQAEVMSHSQSHSCSSQILSENDLCQSGSTGANDNVFLGPVASV